MTSLIKCGKSQIRKSVGKVTRCDWREKVWKAWQRFTNMTLCDMFDNVFQKWQSVTYKTVWQILQSVTMALVWKMCQSGTNVIKFNKYDKCDKV